MNARSRLGLPFVRIRTLFVAFVVFLVTGLSVSQFGKYLSAPSRQTLLSEKGLPVTCEGRWIYIYNLSSVFNQDFVANCSTFKKNVDLCPYMEHGGMGRAFNYEPELFSGDVWFNTWQFSLEVYFHQRLLNYPCIAHAEELADIFYVPFYAGMDLTMRMTHRQLKRDALYKDLLEWLREQFFFNRHGGLDHFTTLGRIALDFRRPKGDSWGTQMLFHPDFKNMIKLTIERDGGTPSYSNNEIAIPYPTHFHASDDAQVRQLISWAMQSTQRSSFVSTAGVRRQRLGGIREKIVRDCESDMRCTLLLCEGHEGINQTDLNLRYPGNIPIAGHNLHTSCSYPSAVLDVFHNSQFCLQPPGDSPTRRSFFDSMLAGCIPVIFKPTAAWTQYTSFLPENGEGYSVLIPLSKIRKENVIDFLAKIPQHKIASMRAKLGELLPQILYAHVSRKYSFATTRTKTKLSDVEQVMETPDAFDIALQEVYLLIQRNMRY